MASFDASQIDHWSDLPDSHHQLPVLIRRLVQATAEVSAIDMPGGSSVRRGGWDGLVTATQGLPWVPDGDSGWEMSCKKSPGSKADADYNKRTADPLGVDITNATFVFVASRPWPGKRAWIRDRRAEGRWAQVQAFDADDLVAWLEQAPEVASWFAQQLALTSPTLEGIRELLNQDADHRTETTLDAINQLGAGFRELKTDLGASLSSVLAALRGSAEPDLYADPAARAMAERIDIARDLIADGKVISAQAVLEQIRRSEEQIPADLEFRAITNLAMCALADDECEGAKRLFEEAYNLQPDKPAAMSNAAVAAQLGNDHDNAVRLATRARALEPQNPQATAVLMQSLWESGFAEQVEDLLAAEDWIIRDRNCVSVLATIRHQESRFDDATGLIRYLIETDPDDAYAHFSLSQCLIGHAQAEYLSGEHTDDIFSRLREAESEATLAIELLRQTELDTQLQTALVARACARALLEANDDALRDLDEVLDKAPGHPAAALNKGLLLRREGRPAEARNILETIQDPAQRAAAAMALAESCLAMGDGLAAIELLTRTYSLSDPEWDDVHKVEILCRSEVIANAESAAGMAVEAALQREPENPRLLTMDAICRSVREDTDGAERAFSKALEHADGSDRWHILDRLGFHYQELGLFSQAADCFAEVVGGMAAHWLAVPLMIALVNGKRLGEALHWARVIRETHRQVLPVVIEVEASILGHIGDAEGAVRAYELLCSRPEATAADHATLAQAQIRCGDREGALKTVQSIDVRDHVHDPHAVLQFGQLKRFLGLDDYLEDAYLARRHAINDPAVNLAYVQLVVGREGYLPEPETVGPGCAVRLKDGATAHWWLILEDGEEARGEYELHSDTGLAKILMGKSVGDTIVVPGAIETRHWEILEVQSKFVRAFQETIGGYSMRFPEDANLSKITVADDDFADLFKVTDQRAKTVRAALDMYQQGRLPLATFASLIGRSPIQIWREVAQGASGFIRFGTGTAEEVEHANRLLEDTQYIVLDLQALLTIKELAVEELLRNRFRRIMVPQYVVDELHSTLFNSQHMTPAGYLGSDGEGHGFLTEVSEESWAEWLEYVRSVLELAESFERVPSYRLLDIENSTQLFETLTPAGAGAVFAGAEQPEMDMLLVSDDLALASVARSFGVNAVNTQSALEELLRSDAITGERYSECVERLAESNYWYVRVRAEDILQSLEASRYATTKGSRAMFKSLEGPHCTESSAISVLADVVIGLADEAGHDELQSILLLTLETLQHGRVSRPALVQFRNRVAAGTALTPQSRAEIIRTVDTYIATKSIIV